MGKKIIIVTYDKSFDFKSNTFIIGGLETYIQDLALLGISLGFKVIVMLPANQDIETKFKGVEVKGINVRTHSRKTVQKVCNIAISMIDSNLDRVIIASEQMGVKAKHCQVIAIQHGVGWDMPAEFLSKKENISPFIFRLGKVLRCLTHIKKFNSFNNLVCVDYNYLNWYRTLDSIGNDKNIQVIPNYTSSLIPIEEIKEKFKSRKTKFKIVFARRFVDYRGVWIFINISRRLLSEFDNIEITYAGSGPMQADIETAFANNNRVIIKSFKPSESVDFHSQYDIAVIPTIYSEGTSLSLCEAMAAGCLPVVTFVGGMSNMILDGYNGLISYPSEKSFYDAMIKALTISESEFDNIVMNARQTVEASFGFERWKNDWVKILES